MADITQYPWETKQVPQDRDYLAPNGSEMQLLPEVGGGDPSYCTLPVGGVSKAVSHRTVDEIRCFVFGKGHVWPKRGCQKSAGEAAPGSCLTIPCATTFRFRNTGDESLCDCDHPGMARTVEGCRRRGALELASRLCSENSLVTRETWRQWLVF